MACVATFLFACFVQASIERSSCSVCHLVSYKKGICLGTMTQIRQFSLWKWLSCFGFDVCIDKCFWIASGFPADGRPLLVDNIHCHWWVPQCQCLCSVGVMETDCLPNEHVIGHTCNASAHLASADSVSWNTSIPNCSSEFNCCKHFLLKSATTSSL